MSNDELKKQFDRCKELQDSGQWFTLACAYLQRGYTLNAAYCFRQSEACHLAVAARE
jgi:hypothetical protein